MDETQASQHVLGFLFNEKLTKVVLIRKKRPEWQRNLLNGVGGKIEEGETSLNAMIRECREETGLVVPEWVYYCSLWPPGSHVAVFASTSDICRARTMTDEEIVILNIDDMMLIVPNLTWLIPMAKDAIMNNNIITRVHYLN